MRKGVSGIPRRSSCPRLRCFLIMYQMAATTMAPMTRTPMYPTVWLWMFGYVTVLFGVCTSLKMTEMTSSSSYSSLDFWSVGVAAPVAIVYCCVLVRWGYLFSGTCFLSFFLLLLGGS